MRQRRPGANHPGAAHGATAATARCKDEQEHGAGAKEAGIKMKHKDEAVGLLLAGVGSHCFGFRM